MLVTSPVEGAGMVIELEEAYLSDYDMQIGREELATPLVAVLRSGLAARVVGSGDLEVTWATSPVWKQSFTQLGSGARVTIDVPESRLHSHRTRVVPGTRLLPLANLVGGGTLAALLTVTPCTVSQTAETPRVGQRSAAIQTQATMKRPAPVSAR